MLKHVLMAGAMMISAPALAQEAPSDDLEGQQTPAEKTLTEEDVNGEQAQVPPNGTGTPATETPPAPSGVPSGTMSTQPAPSQSAPTQPTAPTQPMQPTTPTRSAPSTQSPAAQPGTSPTTPVAPSAGAGQGAPQQTAAAQQPASAGDQVAQVVDAEFASYDADADGALKTEEFGKWMVALRTASDPATDAGSTEVKSWVDQAFASADADQSSSVTKAELTGFLSQGAS